MNEELKPEEQHQLSQIRLRVTEAWHHLSHAEREVNWGEDFTRFCIWFTLRESRSIEDKFREELETMKEAAKSLASQEFELCMEIEKFPASEHQTKTVIKASAILMKLNEMQSKADSIAKKEKG